MKKRALREATGIFAILGALFLASLAWCRPLALLWGAAAGFTCYFFRDPEREIPGDESLAVAPADGKIVGIEERVEDVALGRPMLCISIFLSVLDVHVNRSPVAGVVTFSEGKTGIFLDARNPESARKNASRLWVIEGARATVAVKQITGAIARRICPWAKVGDTLAQGERFGMIRFGSRTELYVPLGSGALVRIGDKVQGGLTPLAKLPPTASVAD